MRPRSLGGSLPKQRIHECLGIERRQVTDFFAGADKANGNSEFVGYGEGDAAFGGAIQLRQDDTGDADGGRESLGLREAVLAGGRIDATTCATCSL